VPVTALTIIRKYGQTCLRGVKTEVYQTHLSYSVSFHTGSLFLALGTLFLANTEMSSYCDQNEAGMLAA